MNIVNSLDNTSIHNANSAYTGDFNGLCDDMRVKGKLDVYGFNSD